MLKVITKMVTRQKRKQCIEIIRRGAMAIGVAVWGFAVRKVCAEIKKLHRA